MYDNIFADNNKGTEERVQEVLDEQKMTKVIDKSNEMEQHENKNGSSSRQSYRWKNRWN